jgi:glyoxylase-like metal-dependent hydrolase (beta-lactamase superfamily II)
VFAADVVPTTAHVNDLWIPAFDMLPTESYAFKSRFIREAIDREYLVWFDHDPAVSAGYIRERDGRRVVDPVVV